MAMLTPICRTRKAGNERGHGCLPHEARAGNQPPGNSLPAKTSSSSRSGGADWFHLQAPFSACASCSAPTQTSSLCSTEPLRWTNGPTPCQADLLPKLNPRSMKTIPHEAMAALNIASISPAIANEGDIAGTKACFTSLAGVAAWAPRQPRRLREPRDRPVARRGTSTPLRQWGLSAMGTITPRISEEVRRWPSQAADAGHDDEALSRGSGRRRDPQRSSPVGTAPVGGMPSADNLGQASPAVTSDDFGWTMEVVLWLGFAGEVVVPWAVIWLSNWLSFDVPFWALGPIFGGPIALAVATALIVWLVHTWRSRTNHRRDARHG
jgi:hypothetical protein